MRILVVAATEFELVSLRTESGDRAIRHLKVHFLITGVGMVATAFALGKHLAAHQYDLALNLGIAGSFDRNISLGEVVEVIQDHLSELGAQDDEAFLPIETLGFGQSAFNTDVRVSAYAPASLRQVTAVTVNTVHGHQASIEKLAGRLGPQIESMEGAAFIYACKMAGVPCLQIRAVSNYVEKRNRDAWQIGLAIKNLNSFAAEFLKAIK